MTDPVAIPKPALRLAAAAGALVPPHDAVAEASVLSAVMIDPDALGRVVDFLRADHFYAEKNRRIYEAAAALHVAGTPIDTTTIASWLRDRERLEQVGGVAYMLSIIDATPAIANIRAHAAAVFNTWRIRQVIAIARRTAATAELDVGDVQEFVSSAAAALADVARLEPGAKHERNHEVLARMIREMGDAAQGKTGKRTAGIPTGIECLDQLTGGLHPGTKFTIAALPRVGKTALAMQIAMHVAGRRMGVLFFSTEMSRDDLAIRQLAHLSGIDGTRLRDARAKNILSGDEWNAVTSAVRDASRLPITVDDDHSLTVDDVAARAKAYAETCLFVDKVPLGLVVVDYVQRLAPSKSVAHKGKPEQIEHATKRLKALARELCVPIIELAQQKDLEVDRKTGKRPAPQLGDVAWCKHVDKEADVALYLWRADERDGANLTASIRKQRAGDEGEFWLTFDRKRGRFTDKRLDADRQYVDGGKAWYERE